MAGQEEPGLGAALLPGEAGEGRSGCCRCRGCCGVGPGVIMSVLVASNVAMLLGYDIGVMSGAKRVMQRDLELTDRQVETLVGSLNLVSAIGGIVSGTLADSRLGRRGTVAFACATSVAGSAAMAAAPRDRGFEVLMVGRVLCGIAVGAGIMIAPLCATHTHPSPTTAVAAAAADSVDAGAGAQISPSSRRRGCVACSSPSSRSQSTSASCWDMWPAGPSETFRTMSRGDG